MKHSDHGQQTAFPTIPITRQVFTALGVTMACVVCLIGVAIMLKSTSILAFAVGGAISVLPNAYFAIRVLLVPAPIDARLRLRQLYAAEITKLLICALLFALVFSLWRSLSPAGLLIGFALTHLVYLVLSMRSSKSIS